MPTWVKWLLNWAWGKFGPPLLDWVKNKLKKSKIKKQVEDEEDEVAKVRKEIEEYLEKNPNAKTVPKSLENKMRDAVRRRNDGLRVNV